MMKLKDINETALQEKIDYIFDNFDFRKVAKAMKAVGWAWAITKGGKTRFAVPNEKEIRSGARELLDAMITRHADESNGNISSGGFTWSFSAREDGSVGLLLEFVLGRTGK